jgi:hypothetical protein
LTKFRNIIANLEKTSPMTHPFNVDYIAEYG